MNRSSQEKEREKKLWKNEKILTYHYLRSIGGGNKWKRYVKYMSYQTYINIVRDYQEDIKKLETVLKNDLSFSQLEKYKGNINGWWTPTNETRKEWMKIRDHYRSVNQYTHFLKRGLFQKRIDEKYTVDGKLPYLWQKEKEYIANEMQKQTVMNLVRKLDNYVWGVATNSQGYTGINKLTDMGFTYLKSQNSSNKKKYDDLRNKMIKELKEFLSTNKTELNTIQQEYSNLKDNILKEQARKEEEERKRKEEERRRREEERKRKEEEERKRREEEERKRREEEERKRREEEERKRREEERKRREEEERKRKEAEEKRKREEEKRKREEEERKRREAEEARKKKCKELIQQINELENVFNIVKKQLNELKIKQESCNSYNAMYCQNTSKMTNDLKKLKNTNNKTELTIVNYEKDLGKSKCNDISKNCETVKSFYKSNIGLEKQYTRDMTFYNEKLDTLEQPIEKSLFEKKEIENFIEKYNLSETNTKNDNYKNIIIYTSITAFSVLLMMKYKNKLF